MGPTLNLSDDGRDLIEGGVDDELFETIYGEPDPDSQAQFVAGVRAVCVAGKFQRAMTVGLELAQKMEAITGHATLFLAGLTGPYGNVGWLTPYDDLASFGVAQNDLSDGPGWLSFFDRTAGCFVDDASVTRRTLYRKLI